MRVCTALTPDDAAQYRPRPADSFHTMKAITVTCIATISMDGSEAEG
jgi:hypothetical protein